MKRIDRSAHERGQILVLVGAGMLVFLALVSLVIDAGHAWGQQRETQNGADAAAEAGAVLLAENLPSKAAGTTPPNTDSAVLSAIEAIAAANSVVVESAEYTTFEGAPIGQDVGSLGGSPPPATANGVRVQASQEFDTFLAGIIGWQTMTARTEATAHAGYITRMPAGTVIPVTVPVTIPQCDGSGNLDPSDDPWVPGTEVVLLLCKNGPGNVGWLDWSPPGGGSGELADAIANPNNPPLEIPGWYYVSETGNINAAPVQAALETWIDKPIFIPLFDATCADYPGGPFSPCTGSPGHGSNQWYHFRNWISYTISSVHVTGSNGACGSGLNGSVGCLRGTFNQMMGPGVLGPPVGDEESGAAVGVGLID